MSPGPRKATCLVLGLAFAVAVPGAAQAAQKTVDAGTPRSSQKAFQRLFADINDFLPHRVTVHVGDTVSFRPSGFHTIDLPGRRTRRLPLFTPTGQAVAGSVDAAGAPFAFNGQSVLAFNPLLRRSAFGQRRTYTGARSVNSGLPLARNPKAMTVRFTKAGSFRYFCDVHYAMTGVVQVVARNRPVPSAGADRAAVKAQLAARLRTARGLARSAAPPANTVDVGRRGPGRVSLLDFVPKQLTVPAGTTVTFRSPDKHEVHTATTGPGDPDKEPTSYLGQLTASIESPAADPRALYSSEPPGTLAALTPTFHGNGFWNSGGLDQDPASPQPTSGAVRFAVPGTYQVYCLIHPFMHGTVTVQ